MDSAPRASATDSARTTADGSGRHGLIDLARVAVEDTVRLVQQEIQLAKIELKEMLRSNIKAAVFLGIAAFCGLLFFIMLLVTIALVIPAHALVAGIETVLFLVLAVTGFAVFGYRTRRRRSTAEQLARKLKLNDLRDRLEEFRDDAKAWASAQKRIVKADGKTKVEVQSKESIGRRLLISAAEAALTALAAGYARRLVSSWSTPHERGHAAVSKKR